MRNQPAIRTSRLAIDDASPPSVELTFTSVDDGYFYPEYYEESNKKWIPIPNNEQFLNAGEHKVFVQIPGVPTPKRLMLRMVRVDKVVQPTIFPLAMTACPVNRTTCPVQATNCAPAVPTVCPSQALHHLPATIDPVPLGQDPVP